MEINCSPFGVPYGSYSGLAQMGPGWNQGTEFEGAQLPAQLGPMWSPHGNAAWVDTGFRKGGDLGNCSTKLQCIRAHAPTFFPSV